MNTYDMLSAWLKKEEGFSKKPYLDTLGIPTIGYGFTYLTEEESELILEHRVRDMVNQVHRYLTNEHILLDEYRVCVLANMAYQLGWNGVLKFKNMWKAIRNKDYETAALEMMKSKWYRDTPARCTLQASRMRAGQR